jgi:hypothetical protein
LKFDFKHKKDDIDGKEKGKVILKNANWLLHELSSLLQEKNNDYINLFFRDSLKKFFNFHAILKNLKRMKMQKKKRLRFGMQKNMELCFILRKNILNKQN